MSAQPVDVLAVFAKLMTFGGMFEPRRIVPEWNVPRPTSTLRTHTQAKTPDVRRALLRAESEGLVIRVPDPSPGWNDSAAERAENFWQLTEVGVAALARCGGAS